MTCGIHLIFDQRALLYPIRNWGEDTRYDVVDMRNASEEDLKEGVGVAAEALLHHFGSTRYAAYRASVACARWVKPVDVFEPGYTKHRNSDTWADYLAAIFPKHCGISPEQLISLGERPFGPEHQQHCSAWRDATSRLLVGGACETEAALFLDAALALREGRVPGSRTFGHFDPLLEDAVYDARNYCKRWSDDECIESGHLVIAEAFLYWS